MVFYSQRRQCSHKNQSLARNHLKFLLMLQSIFSLHRCYDCKICCQAEARMKSYIKH